MTNDARLFGHLTEGTQRGVRSRGQALGLGWGSCGGGGRGEADRAPRQPRPSRHPGPLPPSEDGGPHTGGNWERWVPNAQCGGLRGQRGRASAPSSHRGGCFLPCADHLQRGVRSGLNESHHATRALPVLRPEPPGTLCGLTPAGDSAACPSPRGPWSHRSRVSTRACWALQTCVSARAPVQPGSGLSGAPAQLLLTAVCLPSPRALLVAAPLLCTSQWGSFSRSVHFCVKDGRAPWGTATGSWPCSQSTGHGAQNDLPDVISTAQRTTPPPSRPTRARRRPAHGALRLWPHFQIPRPSQAPPALRAPAAPLLLPRGQMGGRACV
ncbi:uncharacterized protein [Kogia breviceps]|uniref:uncharacterized protein n=1 Tax=Kogia breviceps TaxID=27615 RepID=UPI0034D37E33